MSDKTILLEAGLYITYFDIIGYLAIIFSVIAFYQKDKNKMRVHGGISTMLFGYSIYHYNGINGLFVSSVSLISKTLSLFIDERKLKFFQWLSPFLAFIFFFYFNEEEIIGILPAISLIFIVLADTQEDIFKMKLWYFGSNFCWLAYGIILESYPAIVFDIVGFFILLYSLGEILKTRHFEDCDEIIQMNIFLFLLKYKVLKSNINRT